MNKEVQNGIEKAKKLAEKEIEKVKKELGGAAKKVEDYMKKNPEKSAMISAGIGAAIGATLAALLKGRKK